MSFDLKHATTIESCDQAPWIIKERSIANYTRKYIRPLVDDYTYWKLLPRGSQPGKLYGMAKIHKQGCPPRPVLSALNTPEYALSKWLETKIKPFYNSKWSVASSQNFIKDLNSIRLSGSDICVSFDVKSLYTNVPLQEVIDDVTETMYHSDADSFSKVTKRSSQKGFSKTF